MESILQPRRNNPGWNNATKGHDENISECLKYDGKSGVFHYLLAKKMRTVTLDDCSNIVRIKDAEYIITRHVPKKIAYRFLKEMQRHKLIKICNKQKIKLLV